MCISGDVASFEDIRDEQEGYIGGSTIETVDNDQDKHDCMFS